MLSFEQTLFYYWIVGYTSITNISVFSKFLTYGIAILYFDYFNLC